MSVHQVSNTSSTLVCGMVHKETGSMCLRHAGHDGQHLLSHEERPALWIKDPLSCQCGGPDMCPGQKCVFTWPVGPQVAAAALANPKWFWEGAL
jgi:hypothetical protein